MQVTLFQCDVCGKRTPETTGTDAWTLLGGPRRPTEWTSIYLDSGTRDICPECLVQVTSLFKTGAKEGQTR